MTATDLNDIGEVHFFAKAGVYDKDVERVAAEIADHSGFRVWYMLSDARVRTIYPHADERAAAMRNGAPL